MTVVQDRMTAFWFRGHELSTAFGVTLTASRLGSVVSFLATPIIQHKSVSARLPLRQRHVSHAI